MHAHVHAHAACLLESSVRTGTTVGDPEVNIPVKMRREQTERVRRGGYREEKLAEEVKATSVLGPLI